MPMIRHTYIHQVSFAPMQHAILCSTAAPSPSNQNKAFVNSFKMIYEPIFANKAYFDTQAGILS